MSDDNSRATILEALFDCVNLGVEWSVDQLKSACPPRKKRNKSIVQEKEEEVKPPPDTRSTDEDVPCVLPPCGRKPSYLLPGRPCPKPPPACCYIKMQDPCAPCCCDPKPPVPPCPPKSHLQEPREPICGCDLCQKKYADSKCCDQNATFRKTNTSSRHFEKA